MCDVIDYPMADSYQYMQHHDGHTRVFNRISSTVNTHGEAAGRLWVQRPFW